MSRLETGLTSLSPFSFFFPDISYNITENITGSSSRRLTFGDERSAATTRTLRFSNQQTANDIVTVYANVSGLLDSPLKENLVSEQHWTHFPSFPPSLLFLQSGITEFNDPFVLRVDLLNINRTITSTDGNQSLTDLSAFPRVRNRGDSTTQVCIYTSYVLKPHPLNFIFIYIL